MERQEQPSGSPARRSGRGRGQRDAEPEAVVQRTQVMLLAGEAWEPEGAQAVLSSFAHQVLPPAANPCDLTRRALGTPPDGQPPSALVPPAGQASGQLIFFLCRPSSLRERLPRLREVLQGVREQSRSAPAALVGVIVQPAEAEEADARDRLRDLLREVFGAEGGSPPVEVHTAIFKPGRPEGALEVQRVGGSFSRPQISASSMWLDKSKLIQIFGAMLSAGTVAYGGYYFYNNPPM
ncbi:uncharacterized protein C2orf72 homolog [Sphaerodactylus townsendi]|uniref:Uncharacterized protein n=1 Tax=Sphaerodactylus townsendi TaxID=933632 RepID=A0ACB8EDP3_9SAUR|nr:uncharacterized protein C2orf72 homolog [Sphaerodactylus townsendi]